MATTYQPQAQNLAATGLIQVSSSRLPVYFAVLLGYLLFLPPQTSLNIGGSAIPPYRLFLMASALFIMFSAFRGRFQFRWPDLCMILALIWISFAMSMTSTPDEAFTGSVAHIADIGFAHFFARAAFNSTRDLKTFLVLMLPGLLIGGLILVIEAVTYTHIVQGFFSQITGKGIDYQSSPRYGLMRAQGSFAHPIQAGIFFASFLPLYWLSGFKPWVRFTGSFAAICSFATVSSATFLALAFGVLLLVCNWLTEVVENITWRLYLIFAGLFLFAAELGTNSGAFGLLFRFASLNAVSGYNRILIWRYGTENVGNNPWFGLGYGDWERPVWMIGSVDNYWLLTAMRFGLPAAILIILASVLAIVMLARKSMTSPPQEARCERGVAVTVTMYALAVISVSIWLQPQVWYFVLLGLAVSLADAPRIVPRSAIRGPEPDPDVLNLQHQQVSTHPHQS